MPCIADSPSSSSTSSPSVGLGKLLQLLRQSHSVLLLVTLYWLANLLSYFALARLEAAVYAVLAQLKILTTALFSVFLLRRSFSFTKWRALVLLVVGCVLVAAPSLPQHGASSVGLLSLLEGVAAVLLLAGLSGFSAVYFEALLKREKVTIWERNWQLAVWSAVLSLLSTFGTQVQTAYMGQEGGYVWFAQWTPRASLLAILSAMGGLLVAATLKYADAILKTLATSGSIVLSAILGMGMGMSMDMGFCALFCRSLC
ncbi:hypothetical protein EON64_14805 [archaeon]|nr:MAG: hypothetical protein EON64_14805 [archaeon]